MTEPYRRTVEVFGRTFGWVVKPLTMQGLDGWAVRATDGYNLPDDFDRGILEAWFLSREHACRWVDVMIGRMS